MGTYIRFRKWYEAKAWKAVTLCEEFIEEQEKHAGKVFAWMTKAQWQDHYNNEYVGTQIAKKKKTQYGQHKCHPEVPEIKEAMLVKVWFSEQKAELLRKKHIQISKAEVELDNEAADTHMSHVAAEWDPDAISAKQLLAISWRGEQSVGERHPHGLFSSAEQSVGDQDGEHAAAAAKGDAKKEAEEKEAAEAKKLAEAKKAEQAAKEAEEAKALAETRKIGPEALAKEKKAEEKRAKAEADARDPVKQGEKMLQMIMTFLGQLAVQHEILTPATKFDEAVKQVYETEFTAAKSQLKTLRTEIEEALRDKTRGSVAGQASGSQSLQ